MPKSFKKYVSDDCSHYRLNIHKALVVVLLVCNFLVLLSPRVKLRLSEQKNAAITITVENIPSTRQARRTPPPPKPTVPVPSDDESIPEDETIPETTLRETNFFDNTPGGSAPAMSLTPARAIARVFPEYPKEEKGIRGVVKLSLHIDAKGKVVEVLVIDNTTQSETFARAATEAAYGSRYTPAREGGKAVNSWIMQEHRFDIKE